MASTFSDLKIQLMATGENSGTWGDVTNVNLGTAIEEAITGSASVAFSSADVTLPFINTNETQAARNLRLNLTGTSGGARNLIVPAIEKVYIINNGLADTVTVKNAAGTGIAVPTGKTMYVYNNGTNVVDAITHLTSLTLGSALPVASGGTGVTTSTGTGNVVLSNSPALAGTPTTPTAAAGTNTTQVASTAHVFAERTNTATLTNKSINLANNTLTATSAQIAAAVSDETGTGALVFANSPTLVTPALGTPASGVVTNLTGTASININGTVGATTPSTVASTNLSYTGTLTGGTGVINIGSGQVFKDADGNVGIGTGSPTTRLSISKNSALTVDPFINSDVSTVTLENSSATNGNSSAIANRDSGGRTNAYMRFINVDQNFASAITFGTATSGAGSFGERLRITSSGNVGIGTSSPSQPLEIGGASPAIRINSTGSNAGLLIISENGTDRGFFGTSNHLIGSGSSANTTIRANGVLQFAVGGGAERARIDASGNLLVGKTSLSETVNGIELRPEGVLIATSPSDAGIFYRKTTTTVQGVILTRSDVGGTNTLVGAGFANGTFGTVSDQRKKKNIVDARNYLDDLMQLRVVKYNWITDAEDTPKELGWIAQEVEQVFPGMITEMEGNKMLKKEVFMPMMLKAIQELSAKVDTLQAELNTLKGN